MELCKWQSYQENKNWYGKMCLLLKYQWLCKVSVSQKNIQGKGKERQLINLVLFANLNSVTGTLCSLCLYVDVFFKQYFLFFLRLS